MARSQTDRKTLFRATIASLALHLFVVPFFASADAVRDVTGGRSARDGVSGNETTLVARLSFDRRASARARPSVRAMRPAPVASMKRPAERPKTARAPVTPAPKLAAEIPQRPQPGEGRSLESTSDAATRVRVRRRDAEAPLALTLATAPPEASLEGRPSEARPTPLERSRDTMPPTAPPPSVAATPAPTPLAVAVAREGDVAPGGWGQSFAKPLVADDDALATLRAKYRGMRAIAIDVDPSGHATHVEIPDSVTGDAREELARALTAMRYVPAECNGLRCAGTMQLVL